jgi:DNA-binding HxlR family transcriptional regulator
MSKYGQFCPIAKSLEILGDRWTLLIIRDLLTGTTHFNDLERGLPGISRALLARRLRQLQQAGIVEKRQNAAGRQSTPYRLTQAGQELLSVLMPLRTWGETWAFGEPTPEDLDPKLLMWWLRSRAHPDLLPGQRRVAQFDFAGVPALKRHRVSFWLILAADENTLCLTDPGFNIDLLVSAELSVFLKLYAGRITYPEALDDYGVRVEGTPDLARAFPIWFGWGAAAMTPML